METRIMQAEKFAVLSAIATALGGTIIKRAESGDNWIAWINVSLAEGCISLHYNDERKGDFVHVSGEWPRDGEGNMVTGRDVDHKAGNPSINLAASKRPEVAAADIRRRFLPLFAPLYAKALAIVASRATYAAAVLSNGQALAKACGGTYEKTSHRGYRLAGLPEGVAVSHIGDDDIRIELACGIGEACMILRARAAKAKA
jgi:hypothetical protein